MNITIDTKTKKAISIYILICILIVVFLIIRAIINFLNSGRIIVSTDNKGDNIILIDNQDSKIIKESVGEMNVSIKTGQYTVKAVSGINSVSKVVNIGKRQTIKYHVKFDKLLSYKPIVRTTATDIISDDNSLLYVDSYIGGVYKINSNNQTNLIPGSKNIISVQWVNTNYGIGIASNQKLFVINNNRATPLYHDFNNKINSYSVTPGKYIYIVAGKDVFIGHNGGDLRKIFTSQNTGSIISGSNNAVAVINIADNAKHEASANISLISSNGNLISTKSVRVAENESDINYYAWSPDGSKFLVLGGGNWSIFDNKLNITEVIPHNGVRYGISSVTWADNDTILFSENNIIWSYSLSDGLSNILSIQPYFLLIKSLYQKSNNTIYVSASYSDGIAGGMINEITDNNIDQRVYLLNSLGKSYISDCGELYYNSFKGVSFNILSKTTLPNKTTCLNNVKKYLKNQGIDDINGINFSFTVKK